MCPSVRPVRNEGEILFKAPLDWAHVTYVHLTILYISTPHSNPMVLCGLRGTMRGRTQTHEEEI